MLFKPVRFQTVVGAAGFKTKAVGSTPVSWVSKHVVGFNRSLVSENCFASNTQSFASMEKEMGREADGGGKRMGEAKGSRDKGDRKGRRGMKQNTTSGTPNHVLASFFSPVT